MKTKEHGKYEDLLDDELIEEPCSGSTSTNSKSSENKTSKE